MAMAIGHIKNKGVSSCSEGCRPLSACHLTVTAGEWVIKILLMSLIYHLTHSSNVNAIRSTRACRALPMHHVDARAHRGRILCNRETFVSQLNGKISLLKGVIP